MFMVSVPYGARVSRSSLVSLADTFFAAPRQGLHCLPRIGLTSQIGGILVPSNRWQVSSPYSIICCSSKEYRGMFFGVINGRRQSGEVSCVRSETELTSSCVSDSGMGVVRSAL